MLKAGDHVLLPAGAYGSSLEALRHLFGKWRVSHSLYLNDASAGIESFIQANTRLLWLESPSSCFARATGKVSCTGAEA